MRYLIVVKATPASEAGVMPAEELFRAMRKYHEELRKAGVLIDAAGLMPSSKGWRVEYRGKNASIVDGPFAETKELIAGYTIIDVQNEAQARELTRRFPQPSAEGIDCHIEVRRYYEMEDFAEHPCVADFDHIPG